MAEFRDGLWKGTWKIEGKEIPCHLELKFKRQTITGSGMDEFSFFTVDGTFEQIKPFRANFVRVNSDGKTFTCSGFKEIKENGGIFGESTDDKSQKKEQFLIRPTDHDQNIIEQIRSKQNDGWKQKLLLMGFDEYEIAQAVKKCDSLNSAIEYLSCGGGGSQNYHAEEQTSVKPNEEMVQTIISMGFSREEAIETLKTHGNNLELAINSLLG